MQKLFGPGASARHCKFEQPRQKYLQPESFLPGANARHLREEEQRQGHLMRKLFVTGCYRPAHEGWRGTSRIFSSKALCSRLLAPGRRDAERDGEEKL